MIKRKGLAQIPLMIGLLIMAVAVPVATKLVQESQDTRNQAATCGGTYQLCCNNTSCTSPNDTCMAQTGGKWCIPKTVAPSNTPKPINPSATPSYRNCTVKTCKSGKCVSESKSVASNLACPSSNCTSDSSCVSSTPIPTRVAGGGSCIQDSNCTSGNCLETLGMCEPLPNGKRCDTDGQCSSGNCIMITGNPYKICDSKRSNGQSCVTHNQCQSENCQNSVCKAKVAGGGLCTQNSNCTSGNCLETLGMCEPLPNGKRCETDGQCSSGNCIMITGNPYKICDSKRSNGQSCVTHNQCQSENCQNSVCKAKVGASPTPCAEVNQSCTTRNCCNTDKYICTDEGGLSYPICLLKSSVPTIRPTNIPTNILPILSPTSKPTPTSISCAGTGQSCTTRSCCADADVCTDEGLSYPRCVPRNQIPTYIPVPTMMPCAKSGEGCSTKPCCEPYLDVCTDEGLSYPRCVPRNQIPTYIPVPTMMPCAKTNNSCSSTLGCCAMTDKCTSGKCIAPSVTPTTGTNPPNPPGGCSGSKPADKCESKTLYIDAQCVNNQWDWNEQLCNNTGRTETCGGKNYCCPSAGGAWTSDMTKCPAGNCTQCPGKPEAKLKGDADCSGITNINDASIWRSEFISSLLGKTVKNNWRADFDCDGKVTLNDISIWRDNFIKSL